MKLKGNWALGIIVLYGSFALFALGFLFFSTFQRVELVAPDYYDREVRYQDHIDKVHRTAELTEGLSWEFDSTEIRLQFPTSLEGRQIAGTVTFYRPSDSQLDYRIPIRPGSDLSQSFPIRGEIKGLWKMKVDWQVDAVTYYNEDEFTVE